MAKRIEYRCQRKTGDLKIDGVIDDTAWKNAQSLEFFIPVTLEQPVSRTEAKLLYDDNYLYIGFKCFDRDIKATFTKRDSWTWKEDVVEVFLMPFPETKQYFEFQFSPIKTVFDSFIPSPKYSERVLECSDWNCMGILVETFISGTINDSSDIDNYWSIEIAIPFSGLPVLRGSHPEKGDKWLFNLARYDYSYILKYYRELSSCACFQKRDFHNYNDWLWLIFD